MTQAVSTTSKIVAVDDSRLREMAPQIEAQLARAKPAIGEIVKLWAMVRLFQEEAERVFKISPEILIHDGTRGRGRPSKPTDLKALFEQYLPRVPYSTAHRLFTCGGFIAEKFGVEFLPATLQRKIELPLLAIEQPAKLAKIDRRLPKKQEELYAFAEGDSQTSWLDQFADSKSRGGWRGDKGKRRSKAQLEAEALAFGRQIWTGLTESLPGYVEQGAFRLLDDSDLDLAIANFTSALSELQSWRKTPKQEREAPARAALIAAAKQVK